MTLLCVHLIKQREGMCLEVRLENSLFMKSSFWKCEVCKVGQTSNQPPDRQRAVLLIIVFLHLSDQVVGRGWGYWEELWITQLFYPAAPHNSPGLYKLLSFSEASYSPDRCPLRESVTRKISDTVLKGKRNSRVFSSGCHFFPKNQFPVFKDWPCVSSLTGVQMLLSKYNGITLMSKWNVINNNRPQLFNSPVLNSCSLWLHL